MARAKSSSLGVSDNAQMSGGIPFIDHAKSSLAMSSSTSVNNAKDLENKTSGSITTTTFKCQISTIQMDDSITPNFHPKFLHDISRVVDKESMKRVVSKYGIYYKKWATFGGTLEQVNSVSSSFTSSQSSQSLESCLSMSFAESITAEGTGESANLANSLSSQVGKDTATSFDRSSTGTMLVIKGGAPGSYGEDIDDPLESWVGSIDLMPYPIDFNLGLVSDLIPDSWQITNSSDTTVKKLWIDAEIPLCWHV
ncbi:hypothetical protein SAMD00019534_120260 [Acytostelium subglobosum LB1]|uniref:hypothetical protein n=1 Tax=Acytostelium subglobosum LB1 TaxID=1410327 RepID=UPI0006451151|nr:hypothetical protein SAMD00019534_120260 [Acytostelium subglobosum LB1]GAM28850.1 hypothetical protein SAMD00019534_120260 [Acytostelium subglobosum LB1]|eukprot:XP_012748222.1 hypothetical protein SAMD00019534_120260 [Acytostelium subglobosum LB1]